MSAPARFCICTVPSIVANEEKVRFCDVCGERENPIAFAMAQALAGPLAELRDRLRALEARVESQPTPRLVDATEVARMLGKRREWVYRRKVELGGVPLGSGPRPRWGFNPDLVARLSAREDAAEIGARVPVELRQLPGSAPLLPVKDSAA